MRALLALFVFLSTTPLAEATDTVIFAVQTASAEPDQRDPSTMLVYVYLAHNSRQKFASFTADHVDQTIQFVAKGKVVSHPTQILTPITGGALVFQPEPQAEAARVAQDISNTLMIGVELLP